MPRTIPINKISQQQRYALLENVDRYVAKLKRYRELLHLKARDNFYGNASSYELDDVIAYLKFDQATVESDLQLIREYVELEKKFNERAWKKVIRKKPRLFPSQEN